MINARAQNAYGVAHFAQQNHVPQVRWENVDIIGQYLDNMKKEKQLEMMDKNYELAKDQAAFAREKFGYDQERDKVKDGQWDKEFEYNKFNDAENRKANIDLENVRGRNRLAEINARENAFINAENRAKREHFKLFMAEKENAEKRLREQEKLLSTMNPTAEEYKKIANSFDTDYANFESTFFLPYGKNYDETRLEMSFLLWLKNMLKTGSNNGLGI